MVDSSCGGTFLHKTEDEAWDLFENLSDNSQQHATSSCVGTSRKIGNRGMYVPPHPPQSGNSTFEEKVLSALKSLEVKTQILDSHTQSIAMLETQIRQLANSISRRDDGKLPSHPTENPRANYQEQAKAVITLRNGKLVDNKVGEPIKDSDLNENETKGIDMEIKIEKKLEKELSSSSNSKTLGSSPMTSYKPKFPFPQALLPHPHLRKDNKMEDILETFKEVKINLPLLDAIKQVQAYAKFLKDMCTFKRKSKSSVSKKIFLTEQVNSICNITLHLNIKTLVFLLFLVLLVIIK
ncbi:hypothetical protein M9H77_28383 [Catharanthus roseus]|uniref:Uncharacterized protein n=1 Tax=Catharanthus roseus TaxID=4058 RepID=A0ACC0AFD5_CATRO|nr:hypothetical protein M9H77_28383 [Catharanthus roseus]